MRHGVKKARLGRPADQRKALVRGLVTEVLRHGKIKTTKVSRFLEKKKRRRNSYHHRLAIFKEAVVAKASFSSVIAQDCQHK
jgi:hypothetical protein